MKFCIVGESLLYGVLLNNEIKILDSPPPQQVETMLLSVIEAWSKNPMMLWISALYHYLFRYTAFGVEFINLNDANLMNVVSNELRALSSKLGS